MPITVTIFNSRIIDYLQYLILNISNPNNPQFKTHINLYYIINNNSNKRLIIGWSFIKGINE